MSIPRFDPTRRYTDRAEIMALLDRWVAANGNGTYVPPDERAAASLELFPDYGIQQVRDEIAAFVDVVLTLPRRTLIVEIGLGFFGSTHFLWRMMFDRVVTIERSVERCRSFARAFASFTDGYWCGTDGRSGFVYGPSQDPSLVLRTYRNCPEGADVVFIDGDHALASITADWLLYRSLARSDGIVAFHDIQPSLTHASEVTEFIGMIEAGRLGPTPGPIERIVHSRHAGIGYYRLG